MIMKEFQNGLASTLKGLLGAALNVLDLNSTTNLSVQSSLASGLKTIFTSVLYRPMLVCGKSVYSVFSSTIRGLLAVVLGFLRWLKNQIKNLVDFLRRLVSRKKDDYVTITAAKMESSTESSKKNPKDGIKRKRGRPKKNV